MPEAVSPLLAPLYQQLAGRGETADLQAARAMLDS
jgi:hypothetical protein